MTAGTHESPVAVYTAMGANALIATTKFVAAAFTGSSAMLSEGIHSLVDTGNQLLLLLGIKLAQREPDEMHPFGHGQDLYFWGLVVAIVLFGVGGGMSFYEGLTHLQHPTEIAEVKWNYWILALSLVFESVSFVVAGRKLLSGKPVTKLWEMVRTSKDPSVFIVVMEDAADLLGLLVALAGVLLAQYFHDPRLDGVASLMIGAILATIAVFLAYQTRQLLLGESVDVGMRQSIQQIAGANPAVKSVRQLLSMHLGPQEVLLNLALEFRPGQSAGDLTGAIDSLERAIQAEHPAVRQIFIEAQAIAAGRDMPPTDAAAPDNKTPPPAQSIN